ncbi:RNA polymerase sigma-70 factor, ECF subfamily [Algoriphagus locisalis]|uniref:RNA polymerase sigma-70 factor, ECF subfamily n=1 Tax=Algoriphagus locisalis TaxID=305507 RepID=A0A1I6XVZ7_9BACT|nr:sigma-70 family RNA polymerase sigma factor [Algoriphagus locisalis]SFT42695.1 RNA polymerase sigma-70 factor, ECF subfamily [Algoriphagus locisalis]
MEKSNPISLQHTVRKISQGDETSFEELFRLFSKKIYNVSRKMRLSHEEAEEVVQDVFLSIWKNRASLDPELSINAYMIAIIRSLVIKKKRKDARFIAFQQYQITLVNQNSTDSPQDDLIYSEFHVLSMEIIEKLPPAQKQVFKMKHLEDNSFEEIAEKLNVSQRTVENQAYRATKWVKERLSILEIVSVSSWFLQVKILFDSIIK